MMLFNVAKSVVKRIDMLSPHPFFYSFVMSKREKVFFDSVINNSKFYLEFGLGGSTLRAIQQSKAQIYTVESSRTWISCMRKYLILRYFENKRLCIFPVDIGITSEWGRPVSDESRNLFAAYSSNVFKMIESCYLDLVLIDGRFRVACTLRTILECYKNESFKILFHDFWSRDEYHVVLEYLDIVNRIDSMGLFTIKKTVDLKSVRNNYEIYKFIPD